MALPKLASSKYELTLPSTGESVEYRPFLVKEEKMLMVAAQTGKEGDQILAMQELIDACTFGKLDVKSLPTFDLEYLFLQIRGKSVGEEIKLQVTCPDDEVTKVPVDINISKIGVYKDPEHQTDIKLSDDIGVVFTYPKASTLAKIKTKDEAKMVFDIIKSCVSQIYDSENVYSRADMDEKDLEDFFDEMNHQQFQQVQKFFDTMPKVKHTVHITNPNTGVESDVDLEGMATFFQ